MLLASEEIARFALEEIARFALDAFDLPRRTKRKAVQLDICRMQLFSIRHLPIATIIKMWQLP